MTVSPVVVLAIVVTVVLVFLYVVIRVFEPSLLSGRDADGRPRIRKWAIKTRERRQRPRQSRTSQKRDSEKRTSKRRSVQSNGDLRSSLVHLVDADKNEDRRVSLPKRGSTSSFDHEFSENEHDTFIEKTGYGSGDANSTDEEELKEKPKKSQPAVLGNLLGAFNSRQTSNRSRRSRREASSTSDETSTWQGMLSSASRGVTGAIRDVGALVVAPVAITGAATINGAQNIREKFSSSHNIKDEEDEIDVYSDDEEARMSHRRSRYFSPQEGQRFAEAAISKHELLVATLKPHEELTTAVAFSPSGQYIATAGGEHESEVRLTLRSTMGQDSELMRTLSINLPVEDWVGALSFSKDGFFLLVGTGMLGQVFVYRIYRRFSTKPSLECSFETQHFGPIRHLYMTTAPGTENYFIATAASGSDTTLKFWGFSKKPKLIYKYELGDRFAEIDQVRFSASGKLLAVVGREDYSEECIGGVLFFMVRFGNLGRLRKVWTVHRIEEAKVPVDELEGVTDIAFGQRSSIIAVLQGPSWKLLKVRDGRLARLTSYENPNPDALPFSAIALSEQGQMIVTGRGGDLYYFRLHNDDSEPPKLLEVISGAQNSQIRRIFVAPSEDQIASLGANSESSRVWILR